MVILAATSGSAAVPEAGWAALVPWAAIIAGSIAIILALSGQAGDKRDRRRAEYSEAYRVARAWLEMLYRVRRRPDDDKAAAAIISRFHDLQERLDYYTGWLASESPSMCRSYTRLVEHTKMATREPLQQAWTEPVRPPEDATLSHDEHPDVEAEASRFLTDVRDHLSLLPVRRLRPWWRNHPGRKRNTAGPSTEQTA